MPAKSETSTLLISPEFEGIKTSGQSGLRDAGSRY